MADPKAKHEPLTDAEVRAIIREEIAISLAQISNWMHDADHGSIQSRREAQRERDREAGINSD